MEAKYCKKRREVGLLYSLNAGIVIFAREDAMQKCDICMAALNWYARLFKSLFRFSSHLISSSILNK